MEFMLYYLQIHCILMILLVYSHPVYVHIFVFIILLSRHLSTAVSKRSSPSPMRFAIIVFYFPYCLIISRTNLHGYSAFWEDCRRYSWQKKCLLMISASGDCWKMA